MNNAVALSIFASRMAAVCEEAGALLQRAAFSPNIKDRLDYSCAIFDSYGELCAQAAHIPVHLGSMAFAMRDIVPALEWHAGDCIVLNDPYLGGTHLPDVTLIQPVFSHKTLIGFVANRAHHANIGADQPGSMPIASTLAEEGIIIPPTHLVEQGTLNHAVLLELSGGGDDVRLRGDFLAQISACNIAAQRLGELVARDGDATYLANIAALNAYAESLALESWKAIPDGVYHYTDYMDDDGLGLRDIPITLSLTLKEGLIDADFSGSSPQVNGNINCPLSVAAAAVFYVFRCLLPEHVPACAGVFRPITLRAELGSLVNAKRPAAVAAGNVETSSRMVDVVFGALAQALPNSIPAASQGTMNNIAMGWAAQHPTEQSWDYYETLGGGSGASAEGNGMSARQTHMTNTLNTPVESIESHYPIRITEYAIRRLSLIPI